jgi:hypothetical protein
MTFLLHQLQRRLPIQTDRFCEDTGTSETERLLNNNISASTVCRLVSILDLRLLNYRWE